VQIVRLNASAWVSALDFYEALLRALGAPEWHGWSVDALIDSMIYGGINAVEQLYRVEVHGLHQAQKPARDGFREAAEFLAKHGAHCTIDSFGQAAIEVASPLSSGSFRLT